jgi:hypothetical protein
MTYYKFLSPGRYGVLSGFRWPLGEWVHADGPLVPGVNGIHGCRLDDFPYWVGEVCWRIELGGEVLEGERTVVASRGHLLEPVRTWNSETQREFAAVCSARHRGFGHADAERGWVPYAGAAYIAAHGAGVEAARAGRRYEKAFAKERAWQAAWLAHRLGLSNGA